MNMTPDRSNNENGGNGDDGNASQPTATAPSSSTVATGESAEYVGKDGADAADPPTAKDKPVADRDVPEHTGAELEPDEAADVLESRRESREIREAREESTKDDEQVTLDPSD